MNDRDSLVSLRDVSVHYEGFAALEGVNLEIYADDFIGVIGPNGGGKSTLVEAMMGRVEYSGEIIISDALRNGNHYQIGYMPQISEFDREFPISIEEVVMSGLQTKKGLFSRYTSKDKVEARALLKEVGIEHLASRPIGEVSGGEMQRALLCRAIIAEPKLLILDEPTNFVDNKFEGEFYHILKGLSPKMAIIVVSHDLGTIASIVKSIVCVNVCVHRHDSNILTSEQLLSYNCPIQLISHGTLPHTVLEHHK